MSLTWATEREERDRRRTARERGFAVIVFGGLVMEIGWLVETSLVGCAPGADGSFFSVGNGM